MKQVELTENQYKVIKDKYLKDSPTPEAWLENVAKNIALGELLYHPKVTEEDVFKNVLFTKKTFEHYDGESTTAYLLHENIREYSRRGENFKKYIENLKILAQRPEYQELISKTAEEFYNMMASFEFLPNSPTLMNAGRDLQQLSACFVLPVGDSIDEIYESLKNMALVHKCLVGNSLIFTNTCIKKLSDIKIGDKVYIENNYQKVAETHYTGLKEAFRVTTTNGYEITGSKEHKLRIIDENGVYAWKTVGEIKQGDWVAIQLFNKNTGYNKLPKFNYIHKKPYNQTSFKAQIHKIPRELTNGLAYLFGAFLGDGSFNKSDPGRIRFTVGFDKKEIANEISRIVKKLFDIEVKLYKDNKKNTYDIALQSVQIKEWFEFLGVKKENARLIRVPEFILCADSDKIASFLRGVFDTDGCINSGGYISLTSSSLEFIKEVQILLLSLGIPTIRRELKKVNSWQITITSNRGMRAYVQKIKFLTKSKLDRLSKLNMNNIFVRKDYLPNQHKILSRYLHGKIREKYSAIVSGRRQLTYRQTNELLSKINIPELKNLISLNQFYVKVSGIVSEGKKEMYDLTVPGAHSYIANGFISHNSGGGTGFSFSRLRPANDKVISTKGISSGPISFMSMFDKSTDVVKQGGTRRGANMGIMRIDHPDIMNFIVCKKQKGYLENFNISVAITEDFMQKVEANEEYDLINPRTKEAVKKLNAKEVWNSMVKCAWETGDPGFVVIDRINNSDSNPTPFYGQIESTNPCGEQPLLPYESCNLGSINLSQFVNENIRDIDYDKLKKCIYTAIHFLDNVIDMNNYPLPEIEMMSKGSRRIGLGVMGWAEALALMEIPYNSERGFMKAEELMKFIDTAALQASEELARQRGVFPYFKNSIYDSKGSYFRGKFSKCRNAARTTIAPTGTIGIAAGLQGAGIEPFFAVAYVRYNAAGIDALKANKKPEAKDTFFEINPLFKDVAKKYNFFGMPESELWKKIDENHKSIIGITEIPERIQKLFLTAHDLTPLDHVRMQVAFQKFVNNAVSKTVNLKREATEKDVEEVYRTAFRLGAKGVTIYRDGSKDLQILNTNETKKEKEEVKKEKKRSPDFGTKSAYYCMDTGQGPLHIHVNYDEEGPISVFANITPIGTEVSGLTTALGILISKYLELGGDAVRLLKHLNSIKGDKPFGLGPKRVDSIPHGISKVLREHLIKTNKIPGLNVNGQNIESGQTTLLKSPLPEAMHSQLQQQIPTQMQSSQMQSQFSQSSSQFASQVSSTVGLTMVSNLYCPKCYSSNVEIVSGCTKPTCFDCGYSECS